jgi:ribokinase
MDRPKIVVVGSSNTDMVIKSARIPAPGETVLGGEFWMVAGGKGANQAVAAARLGAAVTFIARVGGDIFGDAALRNFEIEGLDTGFVYRDEEAASGVALIVVDDTGENAIAVAPGANSRLTPDDVVRAEGRIAEADAVVLQLEVPLETVRTAIDLARRHGRRVLLNPAPARSVPEALLQQVDVLTPNETEAEMLLGGRDAGLGGVATTAQALRARGVGTVIITMGREGVFVVGPEAEYHVPGRRVNAVDTTGAGDAFSGALAYAWGSGGELRPAIDFAIAASAISVTRRGAQTSLPTREEVERFLAHGRSGA